MPDHYKSREDWLEKTRCPEKEELLNFFPHYQRLEDKFSEQILTILADSPIEKEILSVKANSIINTIRKIIFHTASSEFHKEDWDVFHEEFPPGIDGILNSPSLQYLGKKLYQPKAVFREFKKSIPEETLAEIQEKYQKFICKILAANVLEEKKRRTENPALKKRLINFHKDPLG
ncbi:MAG: hypothetical protein WCJ84_04720 [Candidatus Peregrinibacteria bacterium]